MKTPTLDLRLYTQGSPRERTLFLCCFESYLRRCGFVLFDNAGIDPDLVHRNAVLAESFFDLPRDVKYRYLRKASGRQRGYGEFGCEHAAGTDAAEAFDLKEFFSFGPRLYLGHPYGNDYEDNVFVDEVPGWRAVQEELYAAQIRFLMVGLAAMSELIGMPRDFLPNMAKYGDSMQRHIFYPSMLECRALYGRALPPGCLRSRRHTDINLATVLLAGKGLVVEDENGETARPEPAPGQAILQTGDTYEDLSGGYFRATPHWVENPEDDAERRIVVTVFGHAEQRAVIETVPPMRAHAVKEVVPGTELFKLRRRLNEIGHPVPTPRF